MAFLLPKRSMYFAGHPITARVEREHESPRDSHVMADI
jgi:hypothetical protein